VQNIYTDNDGNVYYKLLTLFFTRLNFLLVVRLRVLMILVSEMTMMMTRISALKIKQFGKKLDGSKIMHENGNLFQSIVHLNNSSHLSRTAFCNIWNKLSISFFRLWHSSVRLHNVVLVCFTYCSTLKFILCVGAVCVPTMTSDLKMLLFIFFFAVSWITERTRGLLCY